MSIKSDNLNDFGKYLFGIYDNMYNSKFTYEGKIKEERINGNIESFIIKLERVKDE
jgi:hypothetical protein